MPEILPATTVLVVDDEGSILKSLQRLFRNQGVRVLTAGSGREGLRRLKEDPSPVALIISDQRMPEMSGSQFLEEAKLIAPDALRFLLTGYSDMEAVIAAVNRGEIHRYLTKPWNDDELLAAVRQAIRQYDLVVENRRLQEVTYTQNLQLLEMNRVLEERVCARTAEIQAKSQELSQLNRRLEDSFMDAVRLISATMDALSPKLGRLMRRTSELACILGEDEGLGVEEIRQIETAALIHDVGLLGLPERCYDRVDLDPGSSENDKFRCHPIVASALLATIEKLQPAAEFIRHHHERIDGSGFPDGLKGDEVPFGARILAVASDYCRVCYGWTGDPAAAGSEERANLLQRKAQRMISQGAGNRYDLRVVSSLLRVIEGGRCEEPAAESDGVRSVMIEIQRLVEGMVISADLRLEDGRLLLARGSVLKPAMIESLRRLHSHQLVGSKLPIDTDTPESSPRSCSVG